MKKVTQTQLIKIAVEKINESEMEKLKANCIAIKNLHDYMKDSYFYKPSKVAALRRSYEIANSRTTEFTLDDAKYIVRQDTKCSCNNVYYYLTIVTDKKTDYNLNIGFINKIINAIEKKESK